MPSRADDLTRQQASVRGMTDPYLASANRPGQAGPTRPDGAQRAASTASSLTVLQFRVVETTPSFCSKKALVSLLRP